MPTASCGSRGRLTCRRDLDSFAAVADPWLRQLVIKCREKLSPKPALALDARIGSAGAEPDTVLAARLHLRLNTFLQNVARARRQLADCLRRKGVAVEAR